MGDEVTGAKFEVKALSCGWGFVVRVILPDGKAEQIVGFKTEAEAEEWIAFKLSMRPVANTGDDHPLP
jgi:hypothetical protein